MSFILHLLYNETPLTSVAAATTIVHEQWREPPKGHLFGRFRSWQGGMVEACPDLSEDDLDGDRSDNAWPEGLPARFDGSVYTFHPNVDLLDQGLMGLIAEGAALNGLHVLDPQNGLLYRPDRRVLTLTGATQLPPKPVVPAATTANLIRSGEVDAVMDPLWQELAQQLSKSGFEPKVPSLRCVERRVGGIGQIVEVSGFHSHGELVMHGQYRLYSPRVTSLWVPVLMPGYARYMKIHGKRLGGRIDAFKVTAEELCGPEADGYGRYVSGRAKIRERAQRWFDGFTSHIVTQGLPRLDAIGSPKDLAGCLLSERQIWRLETKNDVSPIELFGRLVLIYAFDRPNLAKWLAAIDKHRSNCADFRFGTWPDAPASITRLLEHLDSPAFDPSSLYR